MTNNYYNNLEQSLHALVVGEVEMELSENCIKNTTVALKEEAKKHHCFRSIQQKAAGYTVVFGAAPVTLGILGITAGNIGKYLK